MTEHPPPCEPDQVPESLRALAVAHHGTIRDAMLAIDRGSAEIALIVEGAKLRGVLTDGDIRRALLAGASVDSRLAPFVVERCVTVGPSAGRAEVVDLMQGRRVGQVPIVDSQGRLLGLHLLHDVIGNPARPNWAVIMAGGRGARLAPLTDDIPKPMLLVAGRPILERIILHLVGHGIRRVYLSVNYLGHIIRDHFGDGSGFGVEIRYLAETEPLGTGGSLSLLPELPSVPLLAMNGDLVTQFDVQAMLDFHARGGQTATMGVRRYSHVVPFGCVDLDADARIVGFEEKPTIVRDMNAGIYVLDPAVVARVPRGTAFSLPDLFSDCVRRGDVVRGFEIMDDWVDVGRRDQLDAARGKPL